ncbi:MAG: macrolide ABC transporter ATP-binding protein [Aquificota bacterium]|nr:MAG: macrolide ABC transporter ATP-binding protein [Aquificota bacterium]
MAKKIIETVDLWKEYTLGDQVIPVLRGINLVVEEGEFVAIMGPSGAGKSTLMHILGCLDVPTRGKYVLDGEDVSLMNDTHLSQVRNRKLGFVFQAFYLVPWATALENVMLPFLYSDRPPRDARQRAVDALTRMGMGDRLRHKPSELSGGQQQRVAIARAIVNNPSLLLADEPTGNLDSASSREVMEIFQEMNREGRTIVLITHDQEVAAYASRRIILRDGRILEE